MKRARVMTALVCMALGLFSVASGIDPPEKMWEKEFDVSYFFDIALASDSVIYLATQSGQMYFDGALYVLDLDGNFLWRAGVSAWAGISARSLEVLSNGHAVVVGSVAEDESSENSDLFVMEISDQGEVLWSHIYADTITWDIAHDVCVLADGGYAIAGKGHGQAWILRTDANGDTLWTDVWGTHTINYACGVEYDQENDWIAVLAYGRSDSLQVTSPHMLYYTLDGEYLFGTSYPETPGRNPSDLCRAADGGYTFVSEYGQGYTPIMSHTDELGELLWFIHIYGFAYGDAYGIDRTVLDDGYLVSGFAVDSNWAGEGPRSEGARLYRFDGDGNELWDITEGSWGDEFRAALQLPQGGYIAAGSSAGDGYLVRYAPETGIEEGSGLPGGSALLGPVAPNPSSSVFQVRVDLPEAMEVRLDVFDTSGRRVELLVDGLLQSGAHEFSWDASGLSSGCYLVRLSGAGISATQRCVLIR